MIPCYETSEQKKYVDKKLDMRLYAKKIQSQILEYGEGKIFHLGMSITPLEIEFSEGSYSFFKSQGDDILSINDQFIRFENILHVESY